MKQTIFLGTYGINDIGNEYYINELLDLGNFNFFIDRLLIIVRDVIDRGSLLVKIKEGNSIILEAEITSENNVGICLVHKKNIFLNNCNTLSLIIEGVGDISTGKVDVSLVAE